jgi:uncharacterized membrane protein YGL010W
MRLVDQLLWEYGASHQNGTNKLIHWVCVPAIMFSLIVLLFSIPFFTERTIIANWAFPFLIGALIYYFRLSTLMFFGFVAIGSLMLWGASAFYNALDRDVVHLTIYAVGIFVVAWIGQFIGHKIEGKKPSFLKDVRFLLIGPAWLMHFVFRKVGVRF